MRELNETRRSQDAEQSIRTEFVKLCDEFNEFNDYCAFFCKATSLIAADGEPLENDAAQGLERYAYALKNKSQQLGRWLHDIHLAS